VCFVFHFSLCGIFRSCLWSNSPPDVVHSPTRGTISVPRSKYKRSCYTSLPIPFHFHQPYDLTRPTHLFAYGAKSHRRKANFQIFMWRDVETSKTFGGSNALCTSTVHGPQYSALCSLHKITYNTIVHSELQNRLDFHKVCLFATLNC
jgi:hypothetical protein